MTEKLNKNNFIPRAIKIHGDKYDYSKTQYIKAKEPVLITCKKHGDFYQRPQDHILKQCGCPKCKGEKTIQVHSYTKEQFLQLAYNKFGNKFDYSSMHYINYQTPVTIICPIHGKFITTPQNHIHCETGCAKCGREKANLSESSTTKNFINSASMIHNNKYDYSKVEYINSTTKICIICPEHGKFYQTPANHLQGQGCPKCGLNNTIKSLLLTQDQFINRAKIIHNNYYDYSKVVYDRSKTKVIITCPKHGDFEQTPHEHLSGNGCPKCILKSQTKLYNKLCQQFPNLNILFEVTNKIVSWIGTQRFDIYIPLLNCAIEYNGRQHYMPIERFGGELKFEQQKQYDQLKRDKCKENNCTLIEMKYNYSEDDFINLCNKINDLCYQYQEKLQNNTENQENISNTGW